MNICITNDDGIQGEGLAILTQWARKWGDVTVVAPKVQQSGKSHSIEIHRSFEVKKADYLSGVRAFTVDSTPADCVRIALLALQEKFDLVLSGINCGYNLGREIIYSGTVGAALEAAVHGVKAVALSTGFHTFASAQAHLDGVWQFITEKHLLKHADVLNVNIPEETTGRMVIARQGGPFFSDDFLWEGDRVHACGKCVWPEGKDSRYDTDAVLHFGHIAITPLRNDRTDEDAIRALL